MSKQGTKGQKTKEILLNVAIGLLEESGLDAITLRTIGAEAGLSPMAAYRHFKDKSELLVSIAAFGFDQLAEAMQSSLRRCGDDDPRAQLRSALLAYIDFVDTHPHLYSLMAGREVREAPSGLSVQAGKRVFALLSGLVARTMPDAAHDLPVRTGLVLACVHGISDLRLAGHVSDDDGLDNVGRLIAELVDWLPR